MLYQLLYGHSLPFTAVVVIGFWVAIALLGQKFLHGRIPFSHRKSHNDVIGFTAATGGLIYVVLLAFIASTVWIAYDRADSQVNQEASLAGDLFQDASVLHNPTMNQGMTYLRDYVKSVVELEWPAMLRGEKAGRDGWQALKNFYETMSSLKDLTPVQNNVIQEMLTRLNQLYDARRERLRTASHASLQPVIWFVVMAGGFITVAFCWLFGFENKKLHKLSTSMVAATLGLVIFLIVVFNYPFRGKMQISSSPFEQTLRNMEKRLGQMAQPAPESKPASPESKPSTN